MPAKPMSTPATPPSTLSTIFWRLSRNMSGSLLADGVGQVKASRRPRAGGHHALRRSRRPPSRSGGAGVAGGAARGANLTSRADRGAAAVLAAVDDRVLHRVAQPDVERGPAAGTDIVDQAARADADRELHRVRSDGVLVGRADHLEGDQSGHIAGIRGRDLLRCRGPDEVDRNGGLALRVDHDIQDLPKVLLVLRQPEHRAAGVVKAQID